MDASGWKANIGLVPRLACYCQSPARIQSRITLKPKERNNARHARLWERAGGSADLNRVDIGALSISLVEFVPEATPTATNILFPSPAPLTATSTIPPTLTATLGLESPTPTITSTFINSATPPVSCQPPFGWVNQIDIQPGETLDMLAARYRISKDELDPRQLFVE